MNIPLLLVLLCSFGFFGYSLWKKFLLLREAKPDNRFNNWSKRIKSVLLFVFLQKRMFGSFWSGLHSVIFWGFLTVAIGTILGIGETVFGISINNKYYDTYLTILNIADALIIVAVLVALFRRLIIRPKRLTLSRDGLICLLFILALMISDLGSRYAGLPAFTQYLKVSHIVFVCGFLVYLPFSKHFHLVTAIPNVFFRSLESSGKLSLMDCESEFVFEAECQKDFLKNRFSWKHILDLFTCAECGRCDERCPAFVARKALSPKKVIKDLQEGLVKRKEYDGNIILPKESRSCTTCGACQKVCPLFIEHIPKIIEARRFDMMVQGDVPEELMIAIDNVISMEGDIKHGNPYGLSKNCREDWATELPQIKKLYDGEKCDILFWVGCNGAYDARIQKVTKTFADILNMSGVSWGILGKKELCCGEWIRRAGNEYLYQIVAQKNIETLNKYGVKKIVTFCPHCFNTLKNEYSQFGGSFKVLHHTEFLYEMWKYKSVGNFNKKVVYHDPCYLGRHNGIYYEPRAILNNLPIKIKNIKNSKERSFCCGGGGGHSFMEENDGQKINEMRIEQLLEADPEIIATSCPFCITMLENALKAKGIKNVVVKDIVEI